MLKGNLHIGITPKPVSISVQGDDPILLVKLVYAESGYRAFQPRLIHVQRHHAQRNYGLQNGG